MQLELPRWHAFLGRQNLLYNVGVNVVLAAQEHGQAFGESAGPMNAPEGSTNCQPQVQKATATEYLLVNPAKQSNFIIGDLLSGGELSFIVENLPKDGMGCPGTWLFNQMMEHFGTRPDRDHYLNLGVAPLSRPLTGPCLLSGRLKHHTRSRQPVDLLQVVARRANPVSLDGRNDWPVLKRSRPFQEISI